MNVKEYISSGIIESYVLGIATEAERAEFEANCALYPEVLEARQAFELALEQQLLSDAAVPPPGVRARVLEQVSQLNAGPSVQEEVAETPVRRMSAWKWIAAASLVLMAGSVIWALRSQQAYQQLASEKDKLEQQLATSNNRLDTMQQQAQIMQEPGVKMAALKGTPNAPAALATVYWDTASSNKNVYLLVNNLPQTPTDKQYQLWALLDGKPISVGVFDVKLDEKHLLIRMQEGVNAAQAFAITLEPRGGKDSPTMESMYVSGTL